MKTVLGRLGQVVLQHEPPAELRSRLLAAALEEPGLPPPSLRPDASAGS